MGVQGGLAAFVVTSQFLPSVNPKELPVEFPLAQNLDETSQELPPGVVHY